MLNLAASNIAWLEEEDGAVYEAMQKAGFTGLEIAPTRWYPTRPYDHLAQAAEQAKRLKSENGLSVCSMQSIWYGMTQSIFGASQERDALLSYTKQAIDFAAAIHCPNLVFGCPRNRNVPSGCQPAQEAPDFFGRCAEYAHLHGVVISLEPNPPIYHTNFINRTPEAFQFVRSLNHPGLRVNVDIGTMLYYGEAPSLIEENLDWVGHVHISEPGLAAFCHDSWLGDMLDMLEKAGYQGYASIEMSNQAPLETVIETIQRVDGIRKNRRD